MYKLLEVRFYLFIFLLLPANCYSNQPAERSEVMVSDILLKENFLINTGNLCKIKAVLEKADSGKDISIGAIGGSITMGAAATKPENRYVNLVKKWFSDTYPKVNINLYNAGIGATDSKFGVFRLDKHLLEFKPDLVLVEYSINDSANEIAEQTFEGLIRQLLKHDSKPAIIILAMMNAYGGNVEDKHLPVAHHYDIPMVSFRTLFEEKIKNDILDPNFILADSVHPNNKGHEIAAKLIIEILEKVSKLTIEQSNLHCEIPSALYTDKFESVCFLEAEEIDVKKNIGWELKDHLPSLQQPWRLHGKPLFGKVWTAENPGSEICFDYSGKFLALTYWKENSDMGRIKVFIDNSEVTEIDGWGPQTWGGYAQTQICGNHLAAGKHEVKIIIESEKNPKSTGTRFNLMAVGFGK